VDREQPHGVGVLLLGHRLQLPRAHRLLLAHEADEALDVATAQLLVRAREPRKLAHVGVAPAPVPLGEDREVVVVVADDALAELLQGEAVRGTCESLVTLQEGAAQAPVLVRQVGRKAALEREEQRPPRRGPADERERVVGDADERRREHGHERLVVVAVVQEAEVGEEVDHLLLAEVAAAGGSVGLEAGPAELLLVVLGVRPGGEEEDDLARACLARLDELLDAGGDVARLRAAPVGRRSRVARLVRDEQLHRSLEDRVGEAPRGLEGLEVLPELAGEEVVDRREHLRSRAVVLRECEHAARLLAALTEDLDVGVTEAVDRLELVADEEELLAVGPLGEEVDDLALEAVRVLELVHHDRAETPALPLADRRVVTQQVTCLELEILEVERRLAVLRSPVGRAEALEELLEEIAVPRRQLVERRQLDPAARLLVADRPLASRLQLA
jgi:hypothetical protein